MATNFLNQTIWIPRYIFAPIKCLKLPHLWEYLQKKRWLTMTMTISPILYLAWKNWQNSQFMVLNGLKVVTWPRLLYGNFDQLNYVSRSSGAKAIMSKIGIVWQCFRHPSQCWNVLKILRGQGYITKPTWETRSLNCGRIERQMFARVYLSIISNRSSICDLDIGKRLN